MNKIFLGILGLAAACTVQAADYAQYSVSTNVLNVRDQPVDGQVIGKLSSGDVVTVYDTRAGWGRLTPAGEPVQWVSLRHLSKSGNPIARAAASAERSVATRTVVSTAAGIGETDFSALAAAGAFPVPGKNGFTQRDVDILKRGASLKVASGSCARVEFGGKSTLNPGEYYIYCGNNRRLIFTEADLNE